MMLSGLFLFPSWAVARAVSDSSTEQPAVPRINPAHSDLRSYYSFSSPQVRNKNIFPPLMTLNLYLLIKAFRLLYRRYLILSIWIQIQQWIFWSATNPFNLNTQWKCTVARGNGPLSVFCQLGFCTMSHADLLSSLNGVLKEDWIKVQGSGLCRWGSGCSISLTTKAVTSEACGLAIHPSKQRQRMEARKLIFRRFKKKKKNISCDGGEIQVLKTP